MYYEYGAFDAFWSRIMQQFLKLFENTTIYVLLAFWESVTFVQIISRIFDISNTVPKIV